MTNYNKYQLVDQAAYEQQRRLARDLHDVPGQKLAYLRLKLDQFGGDPGTFQPMDIRGELEQMRQAANESLELVRGTLAVLGIGNTPSLHDLMISHSRIVRDRTRLEITSDETGQPLALTTELTQEIFFIFSEALSNVECHAAAQKVAVEHFWSDEELDIRPIMGKDLMRLLPHQKATMV